MKDVYYLLEQIYGREAQIRQFVEEFSECFKSINKLIRNKDKEKIQELINNVSEEIADLEIMTEQMKCMFADDGLVSYYRTKKEFHILELTRNKTGAQHGR